ncbi:hypothetical protein AB0M28_08660, partial [Streptomyces sp. NPDC051940]|uniref:hypothetical protein n=1 Tax=Streptomyces sp. NPDC051940 TaxID=3155675 RepID=UPI003418F1D3
GPANHFFYLLSEGSGVKTINGVTYDSPTFDQALTTWRGWADSEVTPRAGEGEALGHALEGCRAGLCSALSDGSVLGVRLTGGCSGSA